MIVNIRVVIALGMTSVILGETNLISPMNVQINDLFSYLSAQETYGTLKTLIDAKSRTFKNKRIPDSQLSSSEKLNSIYSNAKLAHIYQQKVPIPSALLLHMLNMHGSDNGRLPPVTAVIEKKISKRHIYRSCCDCCRTVTVMIQLPPLSSNLTQILAVGDCPDISRRRECRECRCTRENRTFWVLEEIPVLDMHVTTSTTSRYRFVTVEYPGHCIHANSG